MAQLASNLSFDEIRQQPAAQIPWFTIIVIIQKAKSLNEMIWYIKKSLKLEIFYASSIISLSIIFLSLELINFVFIVLLSK